MSDKITHYSVFINGEWLNPLKRDSFEVQNPATNETFATVTACSIEDVQLALETSKKAQIGWHLTPAQTRANYLFELCNKLKEKKEYFASLIVKEQGKTYIEALGEVDDTIRYMWYAAEAGRRIQGAVFPSDNPNERLEIHKVPYGVTVALCAFNFPLALIGRKLGPALVTGNSIILKPHELTPITTSEFCKLVEEVDIPRGVVNMIVTKDTDAASLLVKSPITKLISLTGSTDAGRAMYRLAADNITGLILELGGKAPFIVLDDADIDKAVEAAVISRFANCGQVCICNEMVMVDERIADEFTDKLIKRVQQIKVGNPFDTSVNMGPNVSSVGLERVHELVQFDVANGAELRMGGNRPEGKIYEKGNWYAPTVLTNIKNDSATAKQELFSPILPIMKINGFDEAMSITNAKEEGLSAYLFTNNYKLHQKAIDQLEVGTIFINKQIVGYIQGYHSGHKTSGIGGEDGIYGIDQFLQKRTVYLDYSN
ncbi:NAD-dependent aldehyde dehydrogenase [Galbibacter orientalis DSM 19592]|uniref:NAD-dependent aldehyde dehydrogenase n=1 Tax=Galbibacter orientalis DSM 19592 TaxID=926559 RepID=I3CAS0_9FLAO|nr:aldehyde dehydrogenase family protein [Galbibacter orientalis]EIJ40713.1 NAD-dependent aldehyde dehydrogenase [Galbibacter orientalis DSM 19592]